MVIIPSRIGGGGERLLQDDGADAFVDGLTPDLWRMIW
jgi:hypothetical protein